MDGSRPLQPAERERIRSAVRDLVAADAKLSLAAVGRSAGVKSSTLSLVLQGTYKGNEDRYLRKLAQWLIARAAQEDVAAARYVPTTVGKLVGAVCRRAQASHTIGLVVTPSGAGKTMALQAWAAAHGHCTYVQAGEAVSTIKALLEEIAARLGISSARRTRAALYRDVRERLAQYYAGGEGARYLVVVDEAQALMANALHSLRNLHDDEGASMGLVLAGTGRLYRQLHDRRDRAMFEQVRSRCRAAYVLDDAEEIPVADVRAVADAVLAALGHAGTKLRAPSVRYLHRLARGDGKLRNVEARLRDVADCAAHAGRAPTFSPAELDFAAHLEGQQPVGGYVPDPFGAGGEADTEPSAAAPARTA